MNNWKPSEKYFIDLFCRMARMTTPKGHEAFVWSCLPNAPHGAPPNAHPNYALGETQVDRHGNYIVHIPGAERTLWVSHCDTADSDPTHVNIIKEIVDDDVIVRTDGKTILGADDKVGCAIMACMIRCGVPGWYLFAYGEEAGCIGSGKCADYCEDNDMSFDHVVSFDRKGRSSIITHQLGMRCCSDQWADALAAMLAEHGLDYIKDDTGSFTDSNEFTSFSSECTNLSVGYSAQHTHQETANLSHAYRLLMAMIEIGHVGLPKPVRDPAIVEQVQRNYPFSRASDICSGFGEFDDTDKKKDIDSLDDDDWQDFIAKRYGGM